MIPNAIVQWVVDAWAFAKCWVLHYKTWEWAPDFNGNSAYCPHCEHEWFVPE